MGRKSVNRSECFQRFPRLFPAGGLARVRGAEGEPKSPVWLGLAPNNVPAELKEVCDKDGKPKLEEAVEFNVEAPPGDKGERRAGGLKIIRVCIHT